MGIQRVRAISTTTDISGTTVTISPPPTPHIHLTAAPDIHNTSTHDHDGSAASQPIAHCPPHPPAPHTADTPRASSLNPRRQKRILDYYTPQAKRRRIHTTPTPSPNTTPTRTNIRISQASTHTAPSPSMEHSHTMSTLTYTRATQPHQPPDAAQASVQPGTDTQPTAFLHAALDTQPSPRNDGSGSGCPQQNSSKQDTVQIQPQPTTQ